MSCAERVPRLRCPAPWSVSGRALSSLYAPLGALFPPSLAGDRGRTR